MTPPKSAAAAQPTASGSGDEPTLAHLHETLATLTGQIEELSHRLDAVQHRLDAAHPSDELSDDVLLAISAACAAYLGKRARVKQVRRRPASGWSKRGRYDIQYSHRQAHAGY